MSKIERDVGFRLTRPDGEVETVWVEYEELVTYMAEILLGELEASGKVTRKPGDRLACSRRMDSLMQNAVRVISAVAAAGDKGEGEKDSRFPLTPPGS